MSFFMPGSMSTNNFISKRTFGPASSLVSVFLCGLILVGCANKSTKGADTQAPPTVAAPAPTTPTMSTGKSLLLTAMQIPGRPLPPGGPLRGQPTKTWEPQPFVHHEDWLALNLDAAAVGHLQEQLETRFKQPLKSRGEAHITVISPPEFQAIKDLVSMNEMETIANQLSLQGTRWTPVCVAFSFTESKIPLATFYILAESTGLLAIRSEIYRRYIERHGDPYAWTPNHYSPHVTIAFTEHDLYEQDGVKKDRSQCAFDIATPEGLLLTHWN